jgi:hypothetical protein
MMNNKCVYIHKLDDTVVYVGSGNLSRVRAKYRRSAGHLKVFDLLKFEIIFSNLSTREALRIEADTINKYWESGKLFNKLKNPRPVKPIDFSEISKYVKYDETSSTFLRWVVHRRSGAKVGDECGSLSKDGYYVVRINGSLYKGHRIAWCLFHKTNVSTELVIDHIDRDKSNNKISNLRLVTSSVNAKNTLKTLPTSGQQNITHRIKRSSYEVRWTDCGVSKSTWFSYSNKRGVRTRNEAFVCALLLRDRLVELGLIVLN